MMTPSLSHLLQRTCAAPTAAARSLSGTAAQYRIAAAPMVTTFYERFCGLHCIQVRAIQSTAAAPPLAPEAHQTVPTAAILTGSSNNGPSSSSPPPSSSSPSSSSSIDSFSSLPPPPAAGLDSSSSAQPWSPMDYLQRILTCPVYDAATVSPVTPLPIASAALGNEIVLKREDAQPIHSFKVRGAYVKVASLTPAQRARGIVAASAGNHAQGVALAASRLGCEATICMPVTTPRIKVASVERLGGRVVLVGDNFDAAQAHCASLVASEGLTPIHPFDDPFTIAGQGTVAKELMEQAPRTNRLFVPVGGGGLAAGCAVYIKQLRPDVEIIGVEPEGAACLKAALEAGKPVELPIVSRFADGVAVRRIGTENFRVLQGLIDRVETVSDDEICAALKDVFVNCRAVAEPAGAVAMAGLRKVVQRDGLQGENLAAILSGANLNFDKLQYVADRCRIGEQAEALIGVTLPERPGAFLTLVQALGNRMITEFNYRRSRDGQATVFVSVQVAGLEERAETIEQMVGAGLPAVDLTVNELAKTHVKFMVGGRPAAGQLDERVYQLEFPEKPGALKHFLTMLDGAVPVDVTMFHYKNQGDDLGSCLCGFATEEILNLETCLDRVGFRYTEVSDNIAYQMFLQ